MNIAAGKRPAGDSVSRPGFDVAGWRRRMQESDIADELFLPIENGDWVDRRFRLLPGEKSLARTRITGVRYLAADPARENLEPERAVQNDFHRLLDSLIKLRGEPGYGALSLSRETFRTSPRRDVPRLRFGLESGDERLQADDAAARDCYRQVRRSIRRAGFVVEDPKAKFDPGTGLTGLRGWTDQLRLRKRRLWWLWLLLLPLLLLIPKCEPNASFFGAPIHTDSFLLLIDRSSSMQSHFPALRSEARRVLEGLAQRGSSHANIIAYDSDAESCLGAITELDAPTRDRLQVFLDGLQSGGGTNLRSGIDIAAAEIAAHDRPTTLIILTDAQDGSIAGMVAERDGVLGQFKNVEIHGYGLTPRFFPPPDGTSNPQSGGATPQDGGAATPQDDNEKRFSELTEMLGGHFGPSQQTKR